MKSTLIESVRSLPGLDLWVLLKHSWEPRKTAHPCKSPSKAQGCHRCPRVLVFQQMHLLCQMCETDRSQSRHHLPKISQKGKYSAKTSETPSEGNWE